MLGIRPEDLEDASLADGDRPRLAAQVTLREALGAEVLAHFTIDARQAMTDEMRELAEDVGDDRGAKPVRRRGAARQAALVGRFSPRTGWPREKPSRSRSIRMRSISSILARALPFTATMAVFATGVLQTLPILWSRRRAALARELAARR